MWDEKWQKVYSEGWGAVWPDEGLIRFCETTYRDVDRSKIYVLDLGCGSGRNLNYLQKAGFACTGIEGAKINLRFDVSIIEGDMTNLNVFRDQTKDLCVDICSIQHNDLASIKKILSEVHRVLKPGGMLFTILRAVSDDHFGTGTKVEENTYTDMEDDLKDKGITHFFSIDEIEQLLADFDIKSIDTENRTVRNRKRSIDHYIVVAQKPEGIVDDDGHRVSVGRSDFWKEGSIVIEAESHKTISLTRRNALMLIEDLRREIDGKKES